MTGTSWEEERAEVWSSILEAVREGGTDPGRTAACHYLLRHMLASALPASPSLRYDGRRPVSARPGRPPLE